MQDFGQRYFALVSIKPVKISALRLQRQALRVCRDNDSTDYVSNILLALLVKI